MDKLYYLVFSAFPGIGPAKFAKLLEKFGNAKSAWEADRKELLEILGDKLLEEFCAFRKRFSLEEFAMVLEKKKIGYITLEDEAYPTLLREIHNAPFVLYGKGNISLLQKPQKIAVVGTRKITDYGREVTQKLTSELSAQGFVIVSGLALGVDGVAHKAAIANNGLTIAVLGSGVDMCTPREHQRLYDEILDREGLILSAFLPGEAAGIGSFPARNKIVAGLSLGVVVTEGAEDSGSLITANFAKEFGRAVFAVPGPITSQLSKGTNNLLATGAIVTVDTKAILDKLGIIAQGKSPVPYSKFQKGDTPEEQKVIDLLEFGALHFDDIVRKMDKDSKAIGSLLSFMELKGLIRQLSDGTYRV